MTSYAPYGAEGIVIRVEADIRRGIPGVDITGLAEGAVREARERVRAAFRNSGYGFPQDRVLINLAPAGVRKEGAALDLPIALAVMAAAGLVPLPGSLMVLGELELSGRLRPVRGALAAAASGLRAGIRNFIVPTENVREAAILAGDRVSPAASLGEAVEVLRVLGEREAAGEGAALREDAPPPVLGGGGRFSPGERVSTPGDFAEVRGQERYKRTLEIAAAGGHNLLVFGPPGAGKTMLARRLPSIMAPLTSGEAVEATRLHSLAGRIAGSGEGGLITWPPFRSPHHSASAEGILGGGRTVRPGEISLAHFGVLFLDEAPEFRARVLQSLREPLEDGVITISRAEGPVRLPAEFQLLLAANPCPCGRLGKTGPGEPGRGGSPAASQDCFCSAQEIYRYWRKFGGALLDRVELRAMVKALGTGEMGRGGGESSAVIAGRVLRAVEIQEARLGGSGFRRNARLPPGLIERFCPLSDGAKKALDRAAERLGFSGRAFHGIIRTARTIADLEGKDSIEAVHVLEAVQHRRLGEDPYDVFAGD